MNYEPNVEPARRLANRIWPKVTARHRDARLVLLGANPTREVRSFATRERIEVTGSVPDVRPFLWRSALAVVPILTARGIQNKVLEALASGLPAVVSPVIAEGLPASAVPGCRIATTDEEFAAVILELLNRSSIDRRALASQAHVDRLTWPERLQRLGDLIAEVAPRRSVIG